MANPSNLAIRWLLERGLRTAAESQMEIRTPMGHMVGQCPDTEVGARWLAYQLSLGFQIHHLQEMVITGRNASVFLDSLNTEQPAEMPPAGTGYLKRGVWWIWNGVSWVKGTRPEPLGG